MSVAERRAMVERPGESLSVRRQCALLNLARSGVYRPGPVTGADDLAMMRRIDELHLKWPFYGSRRMVFELNQAGHGVNRKRVQRLMRVMGIEALVPRPGTSKAAPGHKIHPYLLRGVSITEPNHVWASDITYIPMAQGFLYLVAIIDWASRAVLAWRLSNTMDTGFCIAALDEAMARHGRPKILGLREVVWVDFTQIQPRKASKRRQHAGEDFEPKVFFVTEPIGSSLDNSDLVVEPLDEAQRDFVLLLAVCSDAVPMAVDHAGELLVGFQPLPFERGPPLLEEAPCPALVLIAPELTKGFLEQVGGIEPFVGPQQCLQSLSAL